MKLSKGFLKVDIRKRVTFISYAGNMNSTWSDLWNRFQDLFGEGTHNTLTNLPSYEEHGHPNYEWYAKVKTSEFEEAIPFDRDY